MYPVFTGMYGTTISLKGTMGKFYIAMLYNQRSAILYSVALPFFQPVLDVASTHFYIKIIVAAATNCKI